MRILHTISGDQDMASSMRIVESLKGQILTDYTYTWDAVHTKILIKDDYESLTRVTTETEFSIGGDWTVTTVYFIYPFKYTSVTILDGVARGNLQVKGRMRKQTQNYADTYIRFTPSLVTRNSSGTEVVLATGSISNVMTFHSTLADESIIADVPYYIDCNNLVINADVKLLLKLYLEAMYGPNDSVLCNAYYETALNSNNVMIELPVVP